jgi:uncharacterized small protein (DUF1192 family)
MASLQLPPAARLFMELLAARLEIKVLQREIDELKAQLATRDQTSEI